MVEVPPNACNAKSCRSSGSKSLAGQGGATGVGATVGEALDRMHMPGTPEDRGNGSTPIDLRSPGPCSCATGPNLLPQFEPALTSPKRPKGASPDRARGGASC